ncbi:MAG: efflux RND transporter periplasmic adaptor subunit [Myxococcales bacterium]
MTTSYVPLFAAAALGALACNKADAYVRPPVPVRTRTVQASLHAHQELRYTGTVAPEAEIELSFKASGYATSLLTVRDTDGRARFVQAGDRVHRGTVLANVRQEDYRQSAAEARGALDAARAASVKARLDYDRARNLLASKVIPQADYDAAKARTDGANAAVETAEARLASARIALGDASLRAPVDALVLARSVEIGNLVSPSTVAFRLADVSRIKVRFAVPDEVASHWRIGSPVVVTANALGAAIPAAISKLHPQSSADARTFDVEATVVSESAPLLLGMVVSVALQEAAASSAAVITAPLSSLIAAPRREREAQALVAFVIEEERGIATARQRRVVAGQLVGNEVAIESGLLPGERLVVQGASLLNDGQTVQLVP